MPDKKVTIFRCNDCEDRECEIKITQPEDTKVYERRGCLFTGDFCTWTNVTLKEEFEAILDLNVKAEE